MSRRTIGASLMGAALALGAQAARAQISVQPRASACQVESKGTVPFTELRGRPVAPLMVNDHIEPLLLATGADWTALSKTLIDQLQLPEAVRHVEGGFKRRNEPISQHAAYTVQSLRFGPASWMVHRVDTLVLVAKYQNDPNNLQGEIGWDILSAYDIDLDFARGVLTLYRVSGCEGKFLPWQGPYQAFKTLEPNNRDFTIPVMIDGKSFKGQITTEVRDSVVSLGSAHALGVTPAALAQDPRSELGPDAKAYPRHQFASLQVGDDIFAAPRMTVGDIGRKPTEVMLGMDFLRRHRLWLSYSTGQVFMQAGAGGPLDSKALADASVRPVTQP